MKETSDKLDQATKQLQAAEAEVKKVLLDKEKQLQAAEVEKKRLLIANKEASDKLV
jgi:hypothetical protein